MAPVLRSRDRLQDYLERRPGVRWRDRLSRSDASDESAASQFEIAAAIATLSNLRELGARHRLSADINGWFLRAGSADRNRLFGALEALGTDIARVDEIVFRLSAVEGGIAALAEMNSYLTAAHTHGAVRDRIRARLRQVVVADLLHVRRVEWSASADFLERIAEFERVHPIASLTDLRDRLDDDRRVFAMFHPGLGDLPVAMVWAALMNKVPRSIGEILDPGGEPIDTATATTAVFYSISNCHSGLAGLGVGNELIIDALAALSEEFPSLRTSVTLSPIPGFVAWLTVALTDDPDLASRAGLPRPADEVLQLLVDPLWMRSAEAAEFKDGILRLAARYLCDFGASRRCPDPVGRFHLSNGARIDHLNWAADLSDAAVKSAGGLMVNYRYDLDRMDQRLAIYLDEGRPAASSVVRAQIDALS